MFLAKGCFCLEQRSDWHKALPKHASSDSPHFMFQHPKLLFQKLSVILTTHHIPVQYWKDQEQALPVIWKAFQTTSINLVRSRPNHLHR